MEKRYWKVSKNSTMIWVCTPARQWVLWTFTCWRSTAEKSGLPSGFLGFSVAAVLSYVAPVKPSVKSYPRCSELLRIWTWWWFWLLQRTGKNTQKGRPIKIEGKRTFFCKWRRHQCACAGFCIEVFMTVHVCNSQWRTKKRVDWAAIDGKFLLNLLSSQLQTKIAIVTSSHEFTFNQRRPLLISLQSIRLPKHVCLWCSFILWYYPKVTSSVSAGLWCLPIILIKRRWSSALVLVISSLPGSTRLNLHVSTVKPANCVTESLSKRYQFEAMLSLAGANADQRVKIKPSQQSAVVASLYNKVAALTGGAAINAAATPVW